MIYPIHIWFKITKYENVFDFQYKPKYKKWSYTKCYKFHQFKIMNLKYLKYVQIYLNILPTTRVAVHTTFQTNQRSQFIQLPSLIFPILFLAVFEEAPESILYSSIALSFVFLNGMILNYLLSLPYVIHSDPF
jgi:hypothetical protein